MKVVIKDPGKPPYDAEIPNTLKALQLIVCGYIETVTVSADLCIICNEEDRIRGLAQNCNVCGVDFVGTIVFTGVDGDEFTDCPITADKVSGLFRGTMA